MAENALRYQHHLPAFRGVTKPRKPHKNLRVTPISTAMLRWIDISDFIQKKDDALFE